MNKENKRDNIKKIEYKKLNKSKVVKISLSLFVVIIFAILFAVSLQISKITKTGVDVSDNLAESATEEVSDLLEETEEVEDEEIMDNESKVSAISEVTEGENIDDGIATIDDSLDYTITVTEYTGDTLEAEYDWVAKYLILYVIDANTLQMVNVALFDITDNAEYAFSDYYTLAEGYKSASCPLFVSYYCYFTYSSVLGSNVSSTEFELKTSDAHDWNFMTGTGTFETAVWGYPSDADTSNTSNITVLVPALYNYNYSNIATDVFAALFFMLETEPISYEIGFSSNGGSGEMDAITATYDEEYTLTANTYTRDGYTFTGWNTEADGSGTSYEDGATVSNLTTEDGATVTLYAQWEPITTYIITFDGNGADNGEMESINATYDEEYTLTANTYTRDGYTFIGWNTEANGSGTSYEDGETVSNLTTEDGATVTLYAQWELATVSVNFTKLSSKTNEELEGVEFSLYELICEDSSHEHDTSEDLIDVNNYDTTCWELIDTYTTASDGTFTLSDIDPTELYRLVETKTVDNYLLPSGQWKIEFDYDDNLDEDKAVTVNGVTLQITGISNPPAVTAGDDTIYIYNSSSYDIPTTGAMGIEDYITIGAVIILVGFIGKIHKSKRTVGLRSSRIKASRAETKNIKRISKMQKRCRKMQKKTEKMLKK